MNVVVVGGGKLAYFLSRTLLAKGHAVTVINGDPEECTWLARHIRATIVHGDGSDPTVLEESGADAAEALLAVTPWDEHNLVICQLANTHFEVPQTLALVNDPEHEEVFHRLGVTAVSTTRILASLIEQRVSFDEVINLIPVGEGKATVSEVTLDGDSPVVGSALTDIQLPEDSLIAFILRAGEPVVPRGGTVLEAQDRLVVITLPENHGATLAVLTGEQSEQKT
jgi:trk system potassium uptake protein TrkA